MRLLIVALALMPSLALAQDGTKAASEPINVMVPSAGVIAFRTARPTDQAISIASSQNKTVVTIRMDGSVEFGDGFTADDAAREFWKHLGRSLPMKCEAPQ